MLYDKGLREEMGGKKRNLSPAGAGSFSATWVGWGSLMIQPSAFGQNTVETAPQYNRPMSPASSPGEAILISLEPHFL